jgi:hypothetical protein
MSVARGAGRGRELASGVSVAEGIPGRRTGLFGCWPGGPIPGAKRAMIACSRRDRLDEMDLWGRLQIFKAELGG